ncbi:MAG: DMT family transporter [Candidatus Thermoplasmatota archaeon]|jgi:drug/metabolite transporter (DMT)-like permease|nr:DMT family transporter [Candidatus Thermoplasmatota archaeon]
MSAVPSKRLNPFRPELARYWVFVAIGAVSTAAILVRLSDSHPITIAFWRLFLSTVLISPLAIPGLKREYHLLTRKTVLSLTAVGFVLALHFGLWIWSFQFTGVASSVVLVTTHPIFVAFISYILFKERLGKLAIAGVVLSLTGSFIIMAWGFRSDQRLLWGNLLALGGALMAGIYILAGSSFRKRLSLWTYAFFVYGSATLFLFLGSFLVGADLWVNEPAEYMIFLGLALGPMLMGHTIYNWALKYVSPTFVSVSLLGEPIGSTILAFMLLGEDPSTGALIGGPLVLAGILMVAMRGTKSE